MTNNLVNLPGQKPLKTANFSFWIHMALFPHSIWLFSMSNSSSKIPVTVHPFVSNPQGVSDVTVSEYPEWEMCPKHGIYSHPEVLYPCLLLVTTKSGPLTQYSPHLWQISVAKEMLSGCLILFGVYMSSQERWANLSLETWANSSYFSRGAGSSFILLQLDMCCQMPFKMGVENWLL